ncbi:MAG: sterol-binding protein [Kordiimonas sp.]|nr:sterol-binding protein [Kordiimonas sp.]|tara:strand:+ start:3061 stop:3345 length:285 start_codon:yes stop_codon:yes gene_type:complete
MSLENLTTQLQQTITAGIGHVVKINLTGDGIIILEADGNIHNNDKDADVTLTMTTDTLDGMLAGDIDPQMAFMSGKLQIDGDMSLALKLGDIFS